jgi:hypothetical protein
MGDNHAALGRRAVFGLAAIPAASALPAIQDPIVEMHEADVTPIKDESASSVFGRIAWRYANPSQQWREIARWPDA